VLKDLLLGVVAASHQWSRFDVAQAPRFAARLPHGEFIGVDPPLDRQVM
jgi:hypothetical protein